MKAVLALGVWLVLSLALLIPVNRLAQRLLPTVDRDGAGRRYAYGMLVKFIIIAAFAIVGLIVFGGAAILDTR